MTSATSGATARRFAIGLLALALPLVLTACGSDNDASTTSGASTNETQTSEKSKQGDAQNSVGTATLKLPEESIDFDLRYCMFDATNVLADGPGKTKSDGEIAHLGVDFVLEPDVRSVEARVDLGVDEQFKSSDRGYTFTSSLAKEKSLDIDGDSFVLEADFISLGGTPLGLGTLTVDCR